MTNFHQLIRDYIFERSKESLGEVELKIKSDLKVSGTVILNDFPVRYWLDDVLIREILLDEYPNLIKILQLENGSK